LMSDGLLSIKRVAALKKVKTVIQQKAVRQSAK